MYIVAAEDWSGNVANNNLNINPATNGSNNGNNVMTTNNSIDGVALSNSMIAGGCSLGGINNRETTSPKSSSNPQQHSMHHHSSSATAFSAATGFWSAAYQGKQKNPSCLSFVVVVSSLFFDVCCLVCLSRIHIFVPLIFLFLIQIKFVWLSESIFLKLQF